MGRKILVIEDEADIVTLLKHYFLQEHFEVITASNGLDGLSNARTLHPDLIVLDLMLPGLDGLSINRSLKKDPLTAGIPVVILTAKSDETDRIVGLELGADDYIVKPFNPKELLARVKAILRRTEQEPTQRPERFAAAGVVLDVARHEARAGDVLLELTAKEFSLLLTLVKNSGRVLDRQMLLDLVWGPDYEGTDRTVDVHIRRLRKKLGFFQDRVQTVKQIGYKFMDREDS
ncbi:MAG: response regulator transcription factor [Nitrospirae bacterium]|jgi:two-component system alkaline phosphatase synthesis response regulator PhoP|nr:response regulator transcription factor [Nitrospirota bacterium]